MTAKFENVYARISKALTALGFDAPVEGETSDKDALGMIADALETLVKEQDEDDEPAIVEEDLTLAEAQARLNELHKKILDHQAEFAKQHFGIWTPPDDHVAHLKAAAEHDARLYFSKPADPTSYPSGIAALCEHEGISGLDRSDYQLWRGDGEAIRARRGYQPVLKHNVPAQILAKMSCPGHAAVETGMRKSWCRHCNANMAMGYDGEWKVIA